MVTHKKAGLRLGKTTFGKAQRERRGRTNPFQELRFNGFVALTFHGLGLFTSVHSECDSKKGSRTQDGRSKGSH